MIDLREKGLPNTIVVNGTPVLLNTDYRLWIRFYDDIQDDGVDRDISYLFADDVPFIDDEVLTQLRFFLYNPSITPKTTTNSINEKILDYVCDGDYIYSALYQVYGIDIVEVDMHWHKFQALCNNIVGESTIWGYAKQMRSYKKPSKNYDQVKEDLKMKEVWSFPITLTHEEIVKKEEFDNYFN